MSTNLIQCTTFNCQQWGSNQQPFDYQWHRALCHFSFHIALMFVQVVCDPLLFLCVDEKNWQSDFPYKRHYAYQESKKRWTQFLYLQVTWQCLIAEKLCHLVISFKICSTFLNISPINLFFSLTCKLTFEQINKSLHTDHFNCWAVRNNKTCLLPLG